MTLRRPSEQDNSSSNFVHDTGAVHRLDETIADQAVALTSVLEPSIVSAMSVDIEDYYQVSAFDPYINRDDWSRYPSRVDINTFRILDTFAVHDMKATFFVLGCVAARHPEIVKRIVAEGHELACHGWNHQRVTNLVPQEFQADICRAKDLLEHISGVAVNGYRAPSYSIIDRTLWAHDVLYEAGFLYSSSIAPIKHDHYGIPDAPRFAYKVQKDGLIEIPITTVSYRSKNYPCGGGGWFRLYPYMLSRKALQAVIEKDLQPCVFYFHPWEIDPEQPRIKGLDAKSHFRHYVGLSGMEGKLTRLFQDFRWGRMGDIYLPQSESMKVGLSA
ncbi:DUF3473 domain-containing protein [Granulosicoccus sp.]|nr:DUF3473 domain-containing protein [Granulosicoccus sp.]